MTQALSSWYGVFWTYRRLSQIINKDDLPSFIGVQAEWNHPYYNFHHGLPEISNTIENIEPTLFRANLPDEYKQEMKSYIWAKGTVVSVSTNDREKYSTSAVELLNEKWINITKSYNKLKDKYVYTEKSWILSVISFLKLLDQNFFESDANILLTITWGNAKGERGTMKPDFD